MTESELSLDKLRIDPHSGSRQARGVGEHLLACGAQILAAIRQAAAGQLEAGIAAQVTEVVAVLMAAGDGEDAGGGKANGRRVSSDMAGVARAIAWTAWSRHPIQ